MATVAELKSWVQRVASLNTADTTEAALVINWLNDAYARALGHSGASSRTVTTTPAAAATTILAAAYLPLTSLSQGTVSVAGLYRNQGATGGTGLKLRRVSLDDLQELRTLSTPTGEGPSVYAVRPSSGTIELWPAATGLDTFTIEMSMYPLQLATSAGAGLETSPTSIPIQFHYDLLANLALARAFEYRGDYTRAAYHKQQGEGSLSELAAWMNEQGGIMGPDVEVKRSRTQSYPQPGQA